MVNGDVALLTIHNLAYQGDFPMAVEPLFNLDGKALSPQCLEQQGHVNFLKGGILSADALTTVSKRYAEEIRTSEFGCGLERILQSRKNDLYGVINGADYGEWNPENDPHINESYGRGASRGESARGICRKHSVYPLGPPPLS